MRMIQTAGTKGTAIQVLPAVTNDFLFHILCLEEIAPFISTSFLFLMGADEEKRATILDTASG